MRDDNARLSCAEALETDFCKNADDVLPGDATAVDESANDNDDSGDEDIVPLAEAEKQEMEEWLQKVSSILFPIVIRKY